MMGERIQSVKQEIYEAIARFIERQKLVAQAMSDFGLDLDMVAQYQAIAWVSSVSHIIEDVEKPLDLFPEGSVLHAVSEHAERVKVPQEGRWKDMEGEVWGYYLHGGGCRLTHTHTGEPIDWDCPNVLVFDPWFFQWHLAWQLTSPVHQPSLQHTREWIETHGLNALTALLDEMVCDGMINPDWTLGAKGDASSA
jgi:hypothetical protein